MYHYMICCKLELNLHGNNKLHIYETYFFLNYKNTVIWYVVNENWIYIEIINYACIEHTHY
jgi:hypothetical protein